MSDLDRKEQDHVRSAIRFLRIQMGGLKPVAAALRADTHALGKVANDRGEVSTSIAFRVARLLDAPFDDLLAGRFKPGTCAKCGHRPSYIPGDASDFGDEHTIAEHASHQPAAGLSLVK